MRLLSESANRRDRCRNLLLFLVLFSSQHVQLLALVKLHEQQLDHVQEPRQRGQALVSVLLPFAL